MKDDVVTKLEEVDKKLEDEIANTVTPLAEKVALTASRVELETTKKYAASQSVYAAACDVWVHSDRLLFESRLMQMDIDELTTAVQSLAPEIERLETTLDEEMEGKLI